MTRLEQIEDFLDQKRFAIVGVSRQPKDISRMLFREFLNRGYDVVPVNPEAAEIEGSPCFARIEDIKPPIDNVLVMTPPAGTDKVAEDCVTVGVKRVWMFRGGGKGAVSPQAVDVCESHGMSVVAGECPFMFLPGSSVVHRIHGVIRKIAGSYPH